jgi:hypothetical protein
MSEFDRVARELDRQHDKIIHGFMEETHKVLGLLLGMVQELDSRLKKIEATDRSTKRSEGEEPGARG